MKNGCYNLPRPIPGSVTHIAQNGWGPTYHNTHGPWRMQRYVEIRHVMTSECQYTKETLDPRCAGCIHEQKDRP